MIHLTYATFFVKLLPLQRLGHGNLLTKDASIRYAEKVATRKVEDQPEKSEYPTADEMARITIG
jgi:hypothetical protein